MRKRLPDIRRTTIIQVCVFLAVACCIFAMPVFADTGTYKIKNYTCLLYTSRCV